jgi:hypothetical protein
MGREIDPEHFDIRDALRVIGPLVVGVGLIFTIIGMGSFFSSFGGFEPPRYFWCAFIGLPLMGIGGSICKFAFMGAVTRYIADEVAPVGKDVVNYMADGTKDSVRDMAAAVGEGLSQSSHTSDHDQDTAVVRCYKCNHNNDLEARFCKNCGAPLTKSKRCPFCNDSNDPDAKFCDNCGKAIE